MTTKDILSNLIKIDAGFSRLVNKDDFQYIHNFLTQNNFDQSNILYINNEDGGANLFATKIIDKSREKQIDLLFLGHLDVVDPGEINQWKNNDPFSLFEENNILYGRGAVDMKGSIAAFLNALSRLENLNFNIGIIIVADEEKKSLGAQKLKKFCIDNDWTINQILIGEPTSESRIGDIIKIGRRGSANFDLKLFIDSSDGPGHVAYPQYFKNPINEKFADLIHSLASYKFNDKSEFFQESNLVITEINTKPKDARNMSPYEINISFNIRYNPNQTLEGLNFIIKSLIDDQKIELYKLDVFSNFDPFLSKKTQFCDILLDSIKKVTNYDSSIKTNGGTSDGRFFHEISNIVEFGPLNGSAHKINEHISYEDLMQIEEIYFQALNSFNNLFIYY